MLAKDGMFVIVVIIDRQKGTVRGSPDIISRGFVYLRESQELLKDTRHIIKKTIEDATAKMHPVNLAYVKDTLRNQIGKFLFQADSCNSLPTPCPLKPFTTLNPFFVT